MNKKIRLYIIGATIAILGVAVVALLSTHKSTMTNMASTNTDSSASSAVSTNSVSIENYMFSPMSIKVKVGTTVTWTNKDQVHHSVVADVASKDAPNGPLFGQGETYSFKLTKAGTYTFHCGPHPYMHGTVTVTN